MSTRRIPEPVPMTLNLAPLVDVMMCLIIFFLLGSRLVAEQYRRIELPYAAAAEEVRRDELGQRVVINVRSPEQDQSPASYVIHGWDGQQIREFTLDAAGVAAYLQHEAQRLGRRARELRCVIRADREVPYGQVEAVLRGCAAARIAHVVFSASTDRDAGARP